jgi:hypothetical protein
VNELSLDGVLHFGNPPKQTVWPRLLLVALRIRYL